MVAEHEGDVAKTSNWFYVFARSRKCEPKSYTHSSWSLFDIPSPEAKRGHRRISIGHCARQFIILIILDSKGLGLDSLFFSSSELRIKSS